MEDLLKGAKLRAIVTITVAALLISTGCTQPAQRKAAAKKGLLLTVDFQQGKTLRYKFISSRDITLDWGPMGNGADSAKTKVDKSAESLTMVVAYTPIEVDAYGLAKVQATCESAKVARTGGRQRDGSRGDAADTFTGKTWTFTVGPTGKIEDDSGFRNALKEAGKRAIRPDTSKGVVKDPDMLYDITASQFFLWDAMASRKEITSKAAVGERWQSLISVPAPMILWVARDVNYCLEEIRNEPNGQIAVIRSAYAPNKNVPREWPIPYDVPFQMSGTFGFLRNFQVLSLAGDGEELFNVTAGRTERRTQKYRLEIQTSLPLPIAVNPKLIIDQTLAMELQ